MEFGEGELREVRLLLPRIGTFVVMLICLSVASWLTCAWLRGSALDEQRQITLTVTLEPRQDSATGVWLYPRKDLAKRVEAATLYRFAKKGIECTGSSICPKTSDLSFRIDGRELTEAISTVEAEVEVRVERDGLVPMRAISERDMRYQNGVIRAIALSQAAAMSVGHGNTKRYSLWESGRFLESLETHGDYLVVSRDANRALLEACTGPGSMVLRVRATRDFASP